MPHLVNPFMRASWHNHPSSDSLDLPTSPTSHRASHSPLSPTFGGFSQRHQRTQSSHGHDGSKPRLSPRENNHHHRLSLAWHLGRPHFTTLSPPATIDWEVETPPILMHGPPDDSSGALISGQLKLNVDADVLDVVSFTASLVLRVVQKRPFQTHCKDCEQQETELKGWAFLPAPAPLSRGTHLFPFSALVEGHLPATTESSLGTISYEFAATAITASGQRLQMRQPVVVRRSITSSGHDHHSMRVFPPTNITAHVHYPLTIHPGRENMLRLHMNGLVRQLTDDPKYPQTEFWKVRKVTWRIHEMVKMMAPACDKHNVVDGRDHDSTSEDASGGLSRGRAAAQRSYTYSVATAERIDGWKPTYSLHDSQLDMELTYGLARAESGGRKSRATQPRVICDLRANDGTEVTHTLVLEVVVAQEVAPVPVSTVEGGGSAAAMDVDAAAEHAEPTGLSRVLRMHFTTVVTEESAEGEVSWDCEAPPVYNAVPPSPPAYPATTVESIATTLLGPMTEPPPPPPPPPPPFSLSPSTPTRPPNALLPSPGPGQTFTFSDPPTTPTRRR